ncbi:hypothetical protein B0H16DRAFT_1446893 [Mycena metata]|uniref:Uncharacterized protein n=1 Tax=Mycena metata TaxID=1033252 RepID=A0AAD7KGM2_9AGAR|nr:hypothetical protein B0H16DRAFT_1446893 [Mycena metata]
MAGLTREMNDLEVNETSQRAMYIQLLPGPRVPKRSEQLSGTLFSIFWLEGKIFLTYTGRGSILERDGRKFCIESVEREPAWNGWRPAEMQRSRGWSGEAVRRKVWRVSRDLVQLGYRPAVSPWNSEAVDTVTRAGWNFRGLGVGEKEAQIGSDAAQNLRRGLGEGYSTRAVNEVEDAARMELEVGVGGAPGRLLAVTAYRTSVRK